ncbi:class I SAM-dependent methyltransferase [Flavobacterium sp.]
MKKNWTGERLETFVYSRDTIEHLHRYSIVSEYIENKVVLDIACGEGYGSNIMSEKAQLVYGVDIDQTTIELASRKYVKPNLKFSHGDATNIPMEDDSVDVVVSFETIEHHDQHEKMMSEIKRVLKPNGLMIISTPDKLYYSDIPKFNNKFHVKELYKKEFYSLIEGYFSKVQMLTQKYSFGVSIVENDGNEGLTIYTGSYSEVSKKEIGPLYLIAIASDAEFKQHKASIFEGGGFLNEQTERVYRNSPSFRIGKFILRPILFFRKKS